MQIRPGVTAVILTDAGVLLQRRDDTGSWGLPGGAVDPGETVRDAVVREVREETGLEVEPLRLVGVYSDPALHQVMRYPDGNVVHFVSVVFECVIRGGAIAPGPESLEVAFHDPEQLPADLMPVARIRLRDALARQPQAFVR